MSSQPPIEDISSPRACPSCGAALAAEAVLCVACGYHLQLGRHLATLVESGGEDRPARSKPRAIDPNPFASPQSLDPAEHPRRPEEHVSDLTPWGARRAKAIVDDAGMVLWTIVFAWCCCGPAWFVMLPWYGWRLWSWYELNALFSELRHPYGFSPHGELAGAFQDCKPWLWVGVAAGGLYWMMLGLGFILSLFVESSR